MTSLSDENVEIEFACASLRVFAPYVIEEVTHRFPRGGVPHSGEGWYVWSQDYAEEGSHFLGTDKDLVILAGFIVGMERSGGLICACCELEAATCIGRYEREPEESPACSSCCGHGNEDGYCETIYPDTAPLEQVSR